MSPPSLNSKKRNGKRLGGNERCLFLEVPATGCRFMDDEDEMSRAALSASFWQLRQMTQTYSHSYTDMNRH